MKYQRYHPKIYDDERLPSKKKTRLGLSWFTSRKGSRKALGIDGKKDIEEKI